MSRPKPFAFVARCQCGARVDALDYEYTHPQKSQKILIGWLMECYLIEPIFSNVWSLRKEQCNCELAAVLTQEGAAIDRSALKGMSVSMDVSTGDADAEHRIFGTVYEVMDHVGDKHHVTLLAIETERNFAPAEPRAAEGAGTYSLREFVETLLIDLSNGGGIIVKADTDAHTKLTELCNAYLSANTGTSELMRDIDKLSDEARADILGRIADYTYPTAAAAVPAGGDAVAWCWVGHGLSPGWNNGTPLDTDIALAQAKGWTIEYAYAAPAPRGGVTVEFARELIHAAYQAGCAGTGYTAQVDALYTPPAAQQDAEPMAKHWRASFIRWAINHASSGHLTHDREFDDIEREARALAAKEPK